MLVHCGTTRHDQWCSTHRLNQPHILGNQTINLMCIYIYKCAIIYVWMLVWMFISRDTCKNKKKLAKPTECDHQPRTNSEAATKPNRHVAYLLFVCSDEASLPLWLWETFKCYDNRWNLPSSQQIRRHRLWPVYLCFFTSEAQKPFLRHNEAG